MSSKSVMKETLRLLLVGQGGNTSTAGKYFFRLFSMTRSNSEKQLLFNDHHWALLGENLFKVWQALFSTSLSRLTSLHSSITARNGWRLPTFLHEWTNEWTKDQFFQVNVQYLNFFSKWLPPWDNQLPRQWCARQKPKQARRPCSCWQLYELTQMKLKSRPVRAGAHPDWLV